MDASSSIHPNQLRQERIRHNWRQQDIADQLGTTVISIKRWERGSHQPSMYFREKLCTLFKKSAEELGLADAQSLPVLPLEKEEAEGKQTHSSPTNIPALWTVPYRRNLYFTGRDELLLLLDQHLSEARQGEVTNINHAVLTQPQAIKGLGGIGKTQIAVEYAYRAREQGQYVHTLWINAASKEALVTSFTGLADILPAFSAKSETNQQKLVEAIKRWLELCLERWFLIFDNADDLSLVQEYIPHSGNGSILLTTRAHAVGSLAISIEVEKMGFIEGTHLLLRRAQRFAQASDEEMNEAGNIVVALDHFPLALEQAGAYIEETGCSFGSYLQLYQHHRKALLARRGAQSTNYPDSVATTWSLSFQKIEQSNPAAAELLRLCAFLAPDHIPEELLTNGAQYWPPVLQQATADNLFAFDQMLEALLTFSLVKRLVGDRMLSIHRLVQVVQLERMTPEEQRQWAKRVVSAINVIFPRDPKNEIATWPQCLRYLEQAQACDTLIQQWQLTLTEGADLLDRTGVYLHEHGSYAIAEILFQRALRIYEQSVGPEEHSQMTSPLNGLALLYYEQGKYTEAESHFQQALHICNQSLEPKLTDVVTALNGLANLYRRQGKYTEVEPLFQRALRILEQSLGSEHPQMAHSLNGLADLYRTQGKYTKAEPLYHRALSIYEQSTEPEHPRVATALNGLAALYCEQGRYAEAERLFQRALPILEQSVGPEHPLVAHLLYNLASLESEQGRYAEAERLFQRALPILEQSLGLEHSKVASLLNNLAELYRKQGRYTEAEPLYHRALHSLEQCVGLEHPLVAHLLYNLAELYSEQGRYTEAESFFQRTLSIQEHILEAIHPDIANSLHSIASLREAQGNIEEAKSFYTRALAIREKVYGQQHPKTIDTCARLHSLADAWSQTDGREGKLSHT